MVPIALRILAMALQGLRRLRPPQGRTTARRIRHLDAALCVTLHDRRRRVAKTVAVARLGNRHCRLHGVQKGGAG